ncbi:MAG TPA: hypothetical protein VFT29_01155 [Gemmatimonadaceae bacterium]|nr:hypothetical protein [Gemmatimonadaceae bacterium]
MQFESLPPPMVVAAIATVTWGIVTLVVGVVGFRAWQRRSEMRAGIIPPGMTAAPQQLPPDVSQRLARIEAAVDAIAIEVERISEGQRFLTKLQAERAPLAAGEKMPERQR